MWNSEVKFDKHITEKNITFTIVKTQQMVIFISSQMIYHILVYSSKQFTHTHTHT